MLPGTNRDIPLVPCIITTAVGGERERLCEDNVSRGGGKKVLNGLFKNSPGSFAFRCLSPAGGRRAQSTGEPR